MLSLFTREGRIALGFISEAFDMATDFVMFAGINGDYHDTEERRAKVVAVYLPALISLILASVVSFAMLLFYGFMTVSQVRARRSELQALGAQQTHLQKLHKKIAEAEELCQKTYFGVALALFECIPMGAIGLYFLITKYSIPPFQVIGVFSSGLLLGTKAGAVLTLPYWWRKLKKWHAAVRPELGADLEMSSITDDTPLGRSLKACRTAISDAKRAAAQSIPALSLRTMQLVEVQLSAIDHKVKCGLQGHNGIEQLIASDADSDCNRFCF